jgi:hypothetical protein
MLGSNSAAIFIIEASLGSTTGWPFNHGDDRHLER